jgi:hypothetical protein
MGAGSVDRGLRGRPRWARRFVVSTQIFRQAFQPERLQSPSDSRSTTTSHKNALLVTFIPVSLSVDLVELFKSIAFGGNGGGRGDVD